MCGVLLNFISYKIAHKRNFSSSEHHTETIHPTPLNSLTTLKLNSRYHYSCLVFTFIFIMLYTVHTIDASSKNIYY
jgi:hypothetical protein